MYRGPGLSEIRARSSTLVVCVAETFRIIQDVISKSDEFELTEHCLSRFVRQHSNDLFLPE